MHDEYVEQTKRNERSELVRQINEDVEELRDQYSYLLIVSLSNACAKPDAVVIELADTIVAQVAVGRLGRAEDQTCLTELHHLDSRVSCVGTLSSFPLEHEVLDAIFQIDNVCVILMHLSLIHI